VSTADWIALAVGIILGPSAYAAAHTARRWIRDAINARICPLCGHDCPAGAPERSFSDGVRQLGEQLDQQKEQQ
jgi:hypothetical protein